MERWFLESCWSGEGRVQGLFGRTLRTFSVRFDSVWSEPDETFHVDERAHYADGRSLRRQWIVSLDEREQWSGFDESGGRIQLRAQGGGLVIAFDRAAVVAGFSPRALTLRLRPLAPDVFRGSGVARLFGVPSARTTIVLRRDVRLNEP